MESRGECQEAQRLLGMIKTAFPEVLTAIKTKQLAQEILLNKEEHIGDVEKTGMHPGTSPVMLVKRCLHTEVVKKGASLTS